MGSSNDRRSDEELKAAQASSWPRIWRRAWLVIGVMSGACALPVGCMGVILASDEGMEAMQYMGTAAILLLVSVVSFVARCLARRTP